MQSQRRTLRVWSSLDFAAAGHRGGWGAQAGRRETVGGKKTPQIIARIEDLLRDEVAGDPMSGLRWTRKTTEKIAEQLLGLGIEASPNTVARLLNQLGFSLKTNRKNIESGVPHKPGHRARRNRQLLTIKSTRQHFERTNQPVISVDGKKREMIGLFKNNGRA